MKRDAWFPFYVGDYLRDTQRLTTEQHGAYLLLILDYWTSGAPLPDDDSQLACVARLLPECWSKMRPVLEQKFRVADGVWWHKRVEEELAKAKSITEVRVKAGKISAERRHFTPSKQPTHVPTRASTKPQHMHTQSQPQSPSAVDESGSTHALTNADTLSSARQLVLEAFGQANNPNWFGDAGRVEAWLRDGMDLEADILPTIRRVMAKRGDAPAPKSLAYFDQAIADARATRLRPVPEGTPKTHGKRLGVIAGITAGPDDSHLAWCIRKKFRSSSGPSATDCARLAREGKVGVSEAASYAMMEIGEFATRFGLEMPPAAVHGSTPPEEKRGTG